MVALVAGLAGACTPKITDSVVVRTDAARVAETLASAKDGSVLLLDARPRVDYEAAAIPGAANVRLSDIDESAPDARLEGYGVIMVYGQNPGSAGAIAIAKRLLARRHENVLLFEGGMDAWVGSGRPTRPGRQFGLPARPR